VRFTNCGVFVAGENEPRKARCVNRSIDVPNRPHWGIVQTPSVFIPGNDGSRTNPGHGYPERIEEFLTYGAFNIRAAWEVIRSKALRKEQFIALALSSLENQRRRPVSVITSSRCVVTSDLAYGQAYHKPIPSKRSRNSPIPCAATRWDRNEAYNGSTVRP
jgi:hypothetical protein